MGLLTGGIATIANNALSGLMYPVTVTRKPQAPTAKPWDPVLSPTTQVVSFKGFSASYADGLVDGSRITKNDRKVVVLAKSSSVAGFVPADGDSVAVSGLVGTVIGTVDVDPAGATFTMQVRA